MQFYGEYDVRIDDKGRILFPAGLRKQLPPESQERFIMNRGFENCLTLFPFQEWQKEADRVSKMNPYIKENRDFQRYFNRGMVELVLDAAGRLLIPKRLQEWAGITKDLIMAANANKIEVWDKQRYDSIFTDEPEAYAKLAEKVMGNINPERE